MKVTITFDSKTDFVDRLITASQSVLRSRNLASASFLLIVIVRKNLQPRTAVKNSGVTLSLPELPQREN
jgi:hypothetical protein